MRVGFTHTFSAILLIFSLFMCYATTAEAASGCRSIQCGSTFEALGEEFPELTACFGIMALLSGLPDIAYWVLCEALGEEFPERLSSPSSGDALGEEFPERAPSKDDQDALGEEFPE